MLLNKESKTFVMQIIALKASLVEIIIYFSKIAQIINNNLIKVAVLKQNEAFIKIPAKYSHFLNVFSKKNALVLSEQMNFNLHAIKLEKSK